MEMPVPCDECGAVIELYASHACRRCGRSNARCTTCYLQHIADWHSTDNRCTCEGDPGVCPIECTISQETTNARVP